MDESDLSDPPEPKPPGASGIGGADIVNITRDKRFNHVCYDGLKGRTARVISGTVRIVLYVPNRGDHRQRVQRRILAEERKEARSRWCSSACTSLWRKTISYLNAARRLVERPSGSFTLGLDKLFLLNNNGLSHPDMW